MSTPEGDPTSGGEQSLRCPKCGASRSPAQDLCASCGIVFAKWYARQAGELPQRRSDAQRGHGRAGTGARRWSALAGALAVAAAVAWYALAPEPRGEDVIVTFESGATCRLSDWRFRYVRRYAQTQARGAVLIVGRTQTESRFDSVLRVFEPLGDKLAITREDLLGIALEVRPDDDNSFRRRVAAITLTTRDREHRIEAHEIPKYSRTRVLVPDAAHYYPDHFDDDYMQWANAFVYLVGDPRPECGGNDSFDLTRGAYRKPWTPVHFDFPG